MVKLIITTSIVQSASCSVMSRVDFAGFLPHEGNTLHQVDSSTPVFVPIGARVGTWDPNTHTHTRLMALFWDYPGEPVPER